MRVKRHFFLRTIIATVCALAAPAALAQIHEGSARSTATEQNHCTEGEKGHWNCTTEETNFNNTPRTCVHGQNGNIVCGKKASRQQYNNQRSHDDNENSTPPRECMPSMQKPLSPYC
jgi:hypothetical protein